MTGLAARALAALALVLALTAAAPAARLPDVEDEVMCTTCGVPLNIADSPQADRQRAFIQGQIDRGRSKPEIKEALVAEYGEDVLGLPSDEGFGLAAYAVPLVAAAGGVALLAVLLPRWRRRARDQEALAPAGAAPAPSPADLRRLEKDMARR